MCNSGNPGNLLSHNSDSFLGCYYGCKGYVASDSNFISPPEAFICRNAIYHVKRDKIETYR
jgi:hypothetical protein